MRVTDDSMDEAPHGVVAKHGQADGQHQTLFPCIFLARELEESNGPYKGIMVGTCYGIKSAKRYQKGFDGTKGLKYTPKPRPKVLGCRVICHLLPASYSHTFYLGNISI